MLLLILFLHTSEAVLLCPSGSCLQSQQCVPCLCLNVQDCQADCSCRGPCVAGKWGFDCNQNCSCGAQPSVQCNQVTGQCDVLSGCHDISSCEQCVDTISFRNETTDLYCSFCGIDEKCIPPWSSCSLISPVTDTSRCPASWPLAIYFVIFSFSAIVCAVSSRRAVQNVNSKLVEAIAFFLVPVGCGGVIVATQFGATLVGVSAVALITATISTPLVPSPSPPYVTLSVLRMLCSGPPRVVPPVAPRPPHPRRRHVRLLRSLCALVLRNRPPHSGARLRQVRRRRCVHRGPPCACCSRCRTDQLPGSQPQR
jgi:hypothetical protein